MKRILPICTVLLALTARADFHARFTFVNFGQNPLTSKRMDITPLWTVTESGTNIATGDRQSYTNDSATGSIIVSNMIAGGYLIDFHGPYLTSRFTNIFDTNATGVVNASAYIRASVYINPSTTAYSQAQTDARFHKKSGDTSTNAVFRGTFKIPNGAQTNYVLTATNADGSAAWLPAIGQTNISYTAVTNAPWARTNSPTLFTPSLFGTVTLDGGWQFTLDSNTDTLSLFHSAGHFRVPSITAEDGGTFNNTLYATEYRPISGDLHLAAETSGNQIILDGVLNSPGGTLTIASDMAFSGGAISGASSIRSDNLSLGGAYAGNIAAPLQIHGSGLSGEVGIYYNNSLGRWVSYTGVGGGDAWGLYSYTLAADVFVFSATGGGRVGIKTPSPGFTLDVNGTAKVVNELTVGGRITNSFGIVIGGAILSNSPAGFSVYDRASNLTNILVLNITASSQTNSVATRSAILEATGQSTFGGASYHAGASTFSNSVTMVGGTGLSVISPAAFVTTTSFTNGMASFATNRFANYNTAGFTNALAGANNGQGGTNIMLAYVSAASGTLEYWRRTGANGSTVATIGMWTNTFSAVNSNLNFTVGINDGFVLRSATGVGIQLYAE